VHNIIVDNWQAHVNKPAALACAWFSFDAGVRDHDSADLLAARLWFVDYAVLYAKQHQLLVLLRGRIEDLWGQFVGRAVGTSFAGLDTAVSRMRDAQLLESRRLVDGEWVGWWKPVSVWRGLEPEVPLFAHPVEGRHVVMQSLCLRSPLLSAGSAGSTQDGVAAAETGFEVAFISTSHCSTLTVASDSVAGTVVAGLVVVTGVGRGVVDVVVSGQGVTGVSTGKG
jgi:hypothetical protein